MSTFRDLMGEDTKKYVISNKDLNKMKFKFLRYNKNYFYYDVKGNSFLRGRNSKLPNDYWAGDWVSLKDVTIIKADNNKDTLVDISNTF